MHLFFPIQSHQLLIFCMNDQEFVVTGICGQFALCFYVSFSNILKFIYFLYCFIILSHCISSLLHIISLFVTYSYVFMKLIDLILLSSLTLNTISFTSSVKILCFSLLHLCCNFNINVLFLINFVWFSLRLSTSSLLFSR